jgi:hypothetical protein
MTTVTVSGPAFNGQSAAAAKRMCEHIEMTVAKDGKKLVSANLAVSIRQRTPIYETRIRVQKKADATEVNDSGMVYGPWLEGTGSRNAPVTKFKGYASFRRACTVLQALAPGIADKIVALYVGRM